MNKVYFQTLSYKLRDKEGTMTRYKVYKDKEFKQLMKDNKGKIAVYFGGLNHYIRRQFFIDKKFVLDLDIDNKNDVRIIKNNVNYVCFELNEEFMEELIKGYPVSKNKMIKFTVKFYLKYYAKINKIMYKAFCNIMKRLEGGE